MNFDISNLGDFSLVLVAFGAAFIAALWFALIIWSARDIRRRTRDVFTRILSILLVALLFLPGLLLYLILRPQSTLEDEYQRTLEEEALLQNIEDVATCPGCTRRVQKDWVVCPTCHTLLKKRCEHCGKLLDLPWNICPYCANKISITEDATRTSEMEGDPNADDTMDVSRYFRDSSDEEVLSEEKLPIEEDINENDEGWVRISSIISQKSEEKANDPEDDTSDNRG